MEDFIVVILTMVFLIFSLLRKKPKNLEEDKSSFSPGFDDFFLENNLITPTENNRVAATEPQLFDGYNPEPEYKPDYVYKRPTTKQETTQKPIETTLTNQVVERTISKKRVHPFMKDFSLDKAVVYSEILNRKFE
jgi:hypothetical protein